MRTTTIRRLVKTAPKWLLTRQLFIGAAGAAAIGVGMGAWLQPPITAKADPDPYAHLTINLPPEPEVNYLSAPAWTPAPIPAAATAPADQAPPARLQTAALRELPAQPAWVDNDPRPDQDDAPPPRERRWPSTHGDVLALDEPPPPDAYYPRDGYDRRSFHRGWRDEDRRDDGPPPDDSDPG